jgi:hypothetical protein
VGVLRLVKVTRARQPFILPRNRAGTDAHAANSSRAARPRRARDHDAAVSCHAGNVGLAPAGLGGGFLPASLAYYIANNRMCSLWADGDQKNQAAFACTTGGDNQIIFPNYIDGHSIVWQCFFWAKRFDEQYNMFAMGAEQLKELSAICPHNWMTK